MIEDIIRRISETTAELVDLDPPARLNAMIIGDLRASARSLEGNFSPRALGAVAASADAVRKMTDAVAALIEGDPEKAGDARAALSAARDAFDAQEQAFARLSTDTERFREFFGHASGELAQMDAELSAEKAEAEAASRKAKAQAAELRRRIERENRNAVFNPFRRLAIELQSLIERRKTTEQVARDAANRARDAAAANAALSAPLAAARTLRGLLGDLVAAMQQIANAITAVTGRIGAQQDFADEIERAPELFLRALQEGLETLSRQLSPDAAHAQAA